MATREQIQALKIDENVFELAEDAELKYLVHFAAPFTGSEKSVIPKVPQWQRRASTGHYANVAFASISNVCIEIVADCVL